MNTLRGSYKAADNTLQLSFRNHIENKTKYKNQTIASGQKWCAVGQLIIGIVSIFSGIIILSCSSGLGVTKKCKAIDNSSFGLWSGVIYITTGVLGAYRRNNMKQLQVPFYIGASITSCVASASGIIVMFYYFAYCSGCSPTTASASASETTPSENNDNLGLTAMTFFRFTCYALLIFAHGNGLTFSIIGASFSCCGMECCNQSSTVEEVMSQLQDDTRSVTVSTCPKPPSIARPRCEYEAEDTNDVEQIYFEADTALRKEPLSYISVEEATEHKAPIKKPDKPIKRYLSDKILFKK